MHSTHKRHFTSSCAALALCFPVLALCLGPSTGSAQESAPKKSAQSSGSQTVEPFFYQELTREGLGDIQNVDDKDISEGRVAPDGHMIITGANTEAYVPPGKIIQLLPNFDIQGFKAVTCKVFENDKPTELGFGLEMAGEQPPLIITQPVGGPSRRVMKVVAFDGQGRLRTVMQCIVRSHVANTNVADLDLNTSKEKCSFNIKDNQTLTARHLYLGDICLGRMADKAGKIDMDERRLAPGRYVCKIIAKNEDNILLPGPTSEFVVSKRYTITPTNTDSKIVIPEENLDAKLEIAVAHRPDVEIAKTRVYIAGIRAGEKEGDNFKMALPLKYVPSGPTSIEVIGVAADGTEYPVENLVVDLDNGAWRAQIQTTAEWQHIQENKTQIKQLNEDMQDWLKQAEFEPVTRHTKTVYTLKSITEHFAAGKKGEYMGKAARCMTKMADLQFEAGNLYRKLKMLVPAKNMFYIVQRELLGSTDLKGEQAQKELTSLTNMKTQ